MNTATDLESMQQFTVILLSFINYHHSTSYSRLLMVTVGKRPAVVPLYNDVYFVVIGILVWGGDFFKDDHIHNRIVCTV